MDFDCVTPKQEYFEDIRNKLDFYFKNKIPIKFRLIEPKNFYETKGNIIDLTEEYVIIQFNNIKIIHKLNEIDILTIYPQEYNSIIEFIRRDISQDIRDAIFKRDNFLCQLKLDNCSMKSECIDHIIPISKGGQDNIENLQASCSNCNLKKGSKVYY